MGFVRSFVRSFVVGFTTEFMRHRPATMTPRAFAVGAALFWLFVGSLFLAPCAARAQVPATQPFELAAQWQPWTGQVASLCGPGKNCTVQTLTATSTGAAIRLPYGATVGWPVTTSPTAAITSPSPSLLRLSASGGYVELNGALRKTAGGGPNAITIEDNDGLSFVGVAATSLPTEAQTIQVDTTQNRLWYRRTVSGTGFGPFDVGGGQHPLLNQRTYLLDVGLDGAGSALSWNPAPRPAGSAATVTETCNSMSGSTLGSEPYRYDVKSYTTSAVSGNVCSVLTTLGFKREKSPRWCVRAAPQNLTTERIFVGLSNALPGASDTAATNHYAAFRYSTNVPDSVWQACSADGSTASCTSTGVAPVPASLQLLCVDMRESGAVSFSIDGVVVVRKTTNLPTTTTALGGFWTNETLTTSAKTFNATSASLDIN